MRTGLPRFPGPSSLPNPMPPRRPSILFALLCACLAARGLAQTDPEPEHRDAPLLLDALTVEGDADNAPGYDPTGLGGAEAERHEPPFANDLLEDIGADEMPLGELDNELAALAAAGSDAAQVAAGGENLDLRGFPTPTRRNGFTQTGVPEILNSQGGENIAGSLVSVVGRAAPGGIRNAFTARPKGRSERSLDAGFGTDGNWRAGARIAGVITPKKAWHLESFSASGREGPQDYSSITNTSAGVAFAFKHSRATSTLWSLDVAESSGNPAPGLPDYRLTPGGKIQGPYRPLADFHVNGPEAGLRRRAGSLAFQLESQLAPDLSLSSSTQLLGRDSRQDRFTTGQYVVSTGKFSGIREPVHRVDDFAAVTHQTDLTRRLRAAGDHKLRVGVEGTLTRGAEESRGILASERNLYLPADVQTFDPDHPNYYRPAFSESVYKRIITDQQTARAFASVFADTRTALDRGRTVFTTGLRYDFSQTEVDNGRPGATFPRAEKSVGDLSFHLGVNRKIGRHLLVFANTSTAVSPSTRVDARTGAIQENESTHGYECGARAVLLDRTLSASTIAYAYTNSDIARRNPLYQDPVADADQTQPQLVSSGEEEFRGVSVQLGWKPSPAWTFTGRATVVDAITVSSPDIPEEEGLQLTRLPTFTAAAGARRNFTVGALAGCSVGLTASHVGGVVQTYARSDRERLDYPAYTVAGLSASRTWKTGAVTHTVSASVNNLFDLDLLARVARVGAERGLSLGWRIGF